MLLAWGALDPRVAPGGSAVLRGLELGGYFLFGAMSTAAFPRRVWVGVAVAVIGAVALEFVQGLVPMRDARWIELLAKWLCAVGGILSALVLMYLQQMRARTARPRRRLR